ncbi:hypothetical protein LTR29_010522 [Friedmanniomyces endolithicus]|nr:hypothetical protein LTR29_010522 [Friedmanniomyces endolithicus]
MSPLDVRITVRGLRIAVEVSEMIGGEMLGATMIDTVASVKGRRTIKGFATHADDSRYYEDDRAPPAKRPYRGPDRYEEEDYYAEARVVDVPYRGENDVSLDGRPMRLLLIRNLKESMSEELFAKGLEKLNFEASSTATAAVKVGAPEGSLRRVLIIRDRQTDKSMHFGFAEYHSISDATAALAKAEEMGEKCTISSKIVEVSFPHLSVFPRADFGGHERSEKYTVEMVSTGQQHKYHDERYYPSEMFVSANPPNRESSATKNSEGADGPGASSNNTLDSKDKSKKRKAPGATATAPAFLQHWQNKATELRTEVEKVQAEKVKDKAEKASRLPASGVNTIVTPAAPSFSNQQTFAVDTSKLKCCYLCACQFQTSEGLQRHLKESAKHAESLISEGATAKGHERLQKASVNADSTIKLLLPATARPAAAASPSSAADDQAYRDRAAERRRVETKTRVKEPISVSLKSKVMSNKTSTSTSDTATPAYGKGLNLLQKAGWTAGQGLGKKRDGDGEGGGITAPIEQSLYASGVGLGHEGSRLGDAVVEAQRLTQGGGRGGFAEKTREVARERFERMG